MNPIAILNTVFNNRYFKPIIPKVNQIITCFKKRKIVKAVFDKRINRFIYREKNRVILVDVNPSWLVTYDNLFKNVTEICCKVYTPVVGDIILDVGAGIGEEALIFSSMVGNQGKIYAIEAHPETAFSLARMCQLNNFINVLVSQVAIGSENGQIYIENRVNHSANKVTDFRYSNIKVPIITFDEYIHKLQIKRIDFVKMNIEGGEEYVIKGMLTSINLVKNIAIGCHDFLEENNDSRIKNKVIQFLKENKFSVRTYSCSHIVRSNWVYGINNAKN